MPFTEGARGVSVHPPHLPLLAHEEEHTSVEVIESRHQIRPGGDEVADQIVVLELEPFELIVRG